MGDFCSSEDMVTAREQKTKERSRWCLIWLQHSSALVFQWCGPGRRTSIFSRRFCVCYAGTSSIRGSRSLKGASRSCSRPSPPSSLGEAEVEEVGGWRKQQARKSRCREEMEKRAAEGVEDADL